MTAGGLLTGLADGLRRQAGYLFLAWSLWLSFEYFAFGSSSFVWIPDNGDSNLPARIAAGTHPWGLWNPLAACGVDRFAMGYAGEIDVLLFSVLPGWLSYGFVMWMQRFLAGYFTFRLTRESLRLSFLPALFAGFSYSLFCHVSVNEQWAGFTLYDGLALPGLPFLLWLLGRWNPLADMRCYLYAALLGVTLSLTSHFSFAAFVVLAVLFWFMAISPRRGSAFWGMIAVFLSTWLAGEIPSLWAGLANAPLSQRAQWTVNSILTVPWSLLWRGTFSLFIPFLRDNLLALTLALLGFYLSGRKDRNHRVLFGAAVFCLAFIVMHQLFAGIVLNKLHWLSGFQFIRLTLLTPFLSVLAGASGLALIDEKYRLVLVKGTMPDRSIALKRLAGIMALGIVVAQSVAVKYDVFRAMAGGACYRGLYQNQDVNALRSRQGDTAPFRVATVATMTKQGDELHPAYAWASRLETADGYLVMYSKRYQDYWKQLIAPLSLKVPASFEHFHYWGSRIYLFTPQETPQFLREIPFHDLYRLPLLSLANVRYVLSPQPLRNEHLELVPSDVRGAQVAWEGRALRDRFMGLVTGDYPGRPIYVYENRKVMPRFFLAGSARAFDKDDELLSALQTASHEELVRSVYLGNEGKENVPADFYDSRLKKDRAGTASLVEYWTDRMVLEVSATAPAVLVVTNNYSPFWTVHVNGREKKLFPAYHAFQGVFLEKGSHRVVLEYQPPYAPGRKTGETVEIR